MCLQLYILCSNQAPPHKACGINVVPIFTWYIQFWLSRLYALFDDKEKGNAADDSCQGQNAFIADRSDCSERNSRSKG